MPKTEIKITRGRETSGDLESGTTSIIDKEKAKMSTISLLANATLSNVKTALSYSVANMGNFTGDYVQAEQIQHVLGIVGDVATIGVGFATGPVGGIIAIAGVALSKSLEAVTYFQNERHARIEKEYLRERSGNSLTNGSRGTEN